MVAKSCDCRLFILCERPYTFFFILFTCWLFVSWCQDLPTLYLQGGSIISLAPPHLHVGEFSLSDDLTLLVSLDENGKLSFGSRQRRSVI